MSNRRKPRHVHREPYRPRYFAPDCTEPFHRLFALVGQDAIAEWMNGGARDIAEAVMLAAEELPCSMHRAVVQLLHEAGQCNEKALEDPCLFLHVVTGALLERSGP
jgi:hypothetical protein